MPGWVRICMAYALAVITGGLCATIMSTQVSLQYLTNMGARVPISARLDATLADLTGFSVTFVILTALGLLITLPVSHVLTSRAELFRTAGYITAGFIAITGALLSITLIYQQFLGVGGTPIPAARSLWGLAMIGLGGAVGGLVYAMLARPPRQADDI